MKKRGFTLIELLAVIVILAVIALIATPMILGVIDTARKGAAESSAYGYAESLETYQMKSQVTSTNAKLFDGVLSTSELNAYVEIKGDKPTKGYVEFERGNVIDYQLQFGNYLVKYNKTTKQAEATEDQYEGTNDVLDEYSIGQEVTIDGVSYHVIKNSSSSDNTVTLLRDESIGTMKFDEENGLTDYDSSSLKTYLNTTYKDTFGDKTQYIDEITLLDFGEVTLDRSLVISIGGAEGTYADLYNNGYSWLGTEYMWIKTTVMGLNSTLGANYSDNCFNDDSENRYSGFFVNYAVYDSTEKKYGTGSSSCVAGWTAAYADGFAVRPVITIQKAALK